MRVYFRILVTPVNQPLDPVVRLPRYWTVFSRMLKDPQLLDSCVAPSVLHGKRRAQNHKAQLATAYNELGKELSSQKIRVVGNYTLGKVIGEGTYGKVRMGVHRLTGTRVAIKQIPKAMSAALTREIHHHRQLHHPHVTQLYEVIATEANIWLVTELCSGGELFDYLAEKGRLSEEETRVLFGQLCLAVAYVHEKGIVHRDLKLENVLLDERCRVKLGDFGFTREFERGSFLETFCGTTGYAAPEMLLAKKYLGPEVDVWSLGVILYTLLTGTLPFDDDDESIMRDKVIKGEFEDPEWLSDESRELLSGILRVDPTERFTIAQILTHPWFTVGNKLAKRTSSQLSLPLLPMQLQTTTSLYPQPLSASSVSDATFHSASSEFYSSAPTTPDEFSAEPPSSDISGFHSNASESTLKKLIGKPPTSSKTSQPDTVLEEGDTLSDPPVDSTPTRQPITRTDSNTKIPPAYPTRTPARTKRRSVSSTLSEHGPNNFEKSSIPLPPQDFSSLLHTPAPLIFSTPLERDLLNSMSMLGLDTGQIVHSVLNDACDATGALWWMLKRRTERKAAEETASHPASHGRSQHRSHTADDSHTEGNGGGSLGRTRESRAPIPHALLPAHSAPELQLTPATPTVPVTRRPATPPRDHSPTRLLSPSPSVSDTLAVKSAPSTPSGSMKEKEKENQGSKGRKNRSGSVSIMQRATTALEAAGLVRKKSAEAVREERERREREEREKAEKKNGNGSASTEEPRASHGSGGSSKLKTPPMRAVKDAALSSTPPPTELNPPPTQMGSPWVMAGKQSPPPDTGSPADTLTSLPSIPSRGTKSMPGHRNRASLLSTFQRWFREDPKGKRKEDPVMAQALAHSNSLGSPGVSPVSQRRGGTVKGRGRGKAAGGRNNKAANRAKRASMSSRRSSSVNSRRSSASMQYPVVESPPYSASVSRQRSDPSRRSFGSHTPNSEREEFMSRPSSIQSFVNHPRHRKSPSASSAGSMYMGRTASPLPKGSHRRGGSGSSTRVVRQIQMTPTNSNRPPHLRSNSASSAHSRASSRPGSIYDLSETDSRRNSSPHKPAVRRSLDDTPRRTHAAATFVAHKRQTPFVNPSGTGYLNSLGRSSWKKSWGLEPPGWQTRSAHPAIEVLAVYPAEMPAGIRDVFSGRQSLSMGDESDWVDEEEESPAYVGGLGQMPSSASSTITTFVQAEAAPAPRSVTPRASSKRAAAAAVANLSVGPVPPRANRGKANRSPAGRSSPLPNENVFEAQSADSRGGRRQLPPGRAGPAFRGIQEEDEGEEE
ncbi:Pkinase-domain-containing protein [Lenzites betulinus]|nr:Pkinase-domain-containing protein [Lenzites betulinus]